MKHKYLLPAFGILMMIGCKEKDPLPVVADTTPPVISLKGRTNDTLSLNSTGYVDPGATAMDNSDGDISGRIIVSGNVNPNLTGEYRKYYNVIDAAGNAAAQMTRYVYVRNDADYLSGTYAASANCGATATSAFITGVYTSSITNNEIYIHLGNTAGVTAMAKVNGNAIDMPASTINGVTTNGSGVIMANKKEFKMNYSVSKSFAGAWNCTNTYIKQ